jgi:tetratricopeptide (TPR) repeat protein
MKLDRGSALLALAALLVITSMGRPALGDPKESDEQRAQKLYEVGDDHYAAGRYEDAVVHFQQAYELSPQPALLFNMANAYERMGEYEQAAEHLRRYLESPKAEDVASVRERIRRLELSAKASKTVRGEPGSGASAAPGGPDAAAGVSARANAAQAGRSRVLSYSLLAVGAATVGGGVVFGLLSNQAGDDAADLCTGDGLCTRNARSKLDRQKRFALLSDVSIGAGVICAGTGALLLLLRNQSDEEQPLERASLQVTPSLGSAGLGLEVSGAF